MDLSLDIKGFEACKMIDLVQRNGFDTLDVCRAKAL